MFGFLLVTTPSTVLNLSKFWYFSPESSCSVLTLQLSALAVLACLTSLALSQHLSLGNLNRKMRSVEPKPKQRQQVGSGAVLFLSAAPEKPKDLVRTGKKDANSAVVDKDARHQKGAI